MHDHDTIAEQFEENRAHLRSVAYRMLGSSADADDAVQESWLRLSRSKTSEVENLRGWLTTVVARVCLDMLRSRKSRGEESIEVHDTDSIVSRAYGSDPAHDAEMADSVGLALLVVLETLTPAERLAFVLHDMFAVPFDEIAPIVGRTPTAARQLASRARRRVQGASVSDEMDRDRHRAVVDAFLTASRNGDFAALLTVLDPDVVVRADFATVAMGAQAEVRGAQAVAETFSGRASAARLATVDGVPGAVWMHGGEPKVVFTFKIEGDSIVEIGLQSDQARLAEIQVVIG